MAELVVNCWPSGLRDTTEFPSVNISLDVNLRNHLDAFCKLDGIGWNDYDEQSEISGLNSASRLRTFRKLYEKLGLLYRDADTIRLSRLGKQIASYEQELSQKNNQLLSEITTTAIDILSRYQLRNPADEQSLPASCDVLPCICIWKSMLLLGNKIHYEEMNRVILHVMRMSDLDAAIAKIQEARNYGKTYSEMSEDELQTLLGEQVHTNQPPARIAPWFSFAGWGGLLIDQNSDEAGFRNLSLNAIPLLQSAVDNPPSYYEAKDKDDWLNYYVGSAAIVSNDAVQTSRIPKTGAENILLYGVPGAGKSYYIKKHYPCSPECIERVVFHPDYTYSDFVGQILPRVENYTDSSGSVKESLKYVFTPGPFTKALKKAITHEDESFYLIIEEINRGNAPAIFGEVFQLLDRNDDGKSEYGITNYDIAKEVYGDPEKKIVLPSNLWLLATMNTSDQNVFTLDTAFQRRWIMTPINNDVMSATHAGTNIERSAIKWGCFARVVNEQILDLSDTFGGAGDKRLGAYFAKERELKADRFPGKVLKYLWDDAFKMGHEYIFSEQMKSLDLVIETYNTASGDPLKSVLDDGIYRRMLAYCSEMPSSDSQSELLENEKLKEDAN